MNSSLPRPRGLYNPVYEHDACGVGMVADVHGRASHDVVLKGITVLERLLHRGAAGSDPETGDGAGLLMQIPHRFFAARVEDFELPAPGRYAIAVLFLPRDEEPCRACKALIARVAGEAGYALLGWREVPVNPSSIGRQARESAPRIEQAFLMPDEEPADSAAFERGLYILRRSIENAADADSPALGGAFYIPSLSCRTIVYKGLLKAPQLPRFYVDLTDPLFESAVAIVHQRYSTNTFPSWSLAHPFRYLAHNGEVNTLRGNLNQMSAREQALASPLFGDDIRRILPVIRPGQSDSASLDNALELLAAGGRSLPHAMMMLIPQAWGKKYFMGEDVRGFFDYHSGIMEPWDGPAAVCFTDGEGAGAMVDRNGLRPMRYELSRSGLLVLASEAGVVDTDPADVVERGCLRPGQMLWINFAAGRVSYDAEIKTLIARRRPYRRWCQENRIHIRGFFDSITAPEVDAGTLLARQTLFGYTKDEIDAFLDPMAATGQDPLASMGNDAALAVLSERPQLLFNYFKQLFAQVTNPPIDPIREELVMSLTTYIGNPPNILEESPRMARIIRLERPVLTSGDLDRLKECREQDFRSATLSLGFSPFSERGLEEALEETARQAELCVKQGFRILILSDRSLSDNEAPIPSLLAVAAVNRRLARLGLRTSTGVIVDTGEAREVMHFALLLGFGATAVCPWLALETITDRQRRGELGEGLSAAKALENYLEAIDHGLLKTMSKMGISTLRSYRGAQVFEAVGLGRGLVDAYFPGAASRIGGIGLPEIALESKIRFERKKEFQLRGGGELELSGEFKYRRGKDAEKHIWTSKAIGEFQRSLRHGDYDRFLAFSAMVGESEETLCTLRGLFDFAETAPIPLDEVESEESILSRFVSGAMSFGSISREAHEAIAIAMNRLGAMSNSGEGGEDPARFAPRENGDSACSAVKQIASGRFGVTAEYLAHARELQIKVAQGAKPGEGGQLPGSKVNGEIARVRHSTPGVSLISPPPHHDIYSIEDLAELIFDLRCANPEARVSVKLVSEAGVGTVAAGVAKGGADMVLISGHDGGTGASPLTSIKHAGLPWELGVAEAHQTLVLNGLRDKIRLQADGQIKTGRDVVVAALLGAEEFGFATSILIALGCAMARVCHKNCCPVGVATQDPELRKRFKGKPEYIETYLRFVARQTRTLLARLGLRSIDEAVGRTDLLRVERAVNHWKTRRLDFSAILSGRPLPVHCAGKGTASAAAYDDRILPLARYSIDTARPMEAHFTVSNTDRAVGARLSWFIARKYGHRGLPDGTIALKLDGTAGQSFGAFLARGVTLTLTGQANDYLGKGLSGGVIVVKPFERSPYPPCENVIAGNVLLYGAIEGKVFIRGQVGERFAVRNSGASAVIEGAGNHCCEYMTGGCVIVLGPTGVNFGAGMSGGIAFVWDEDHLFDLRCNLGMVDLDPVEKPADVALLRSLIEEHAALTGSKRASWILEHFDDALPSFVKVFPMEYRRVLGEMSREDAEIPRRIRD